MFSFFLKHEDLFGQRCPSLVWSLLDLPDELSVAIVLTGHCHLYVLHLLIVVVVVLVIRERLLCCKASITSTINSIIVERYLVFMSLAPRPCAYREVHRLFSLLNLHTTFALQA